MRSDPQCGLRKDRSRRSISGAWARTQRFRVLWSTVKPRSRNSSSMSRQLRGQRRYQQTACRISDVSKCRSLKSSFDRRCSFSAIALRIIACPPTTQGKVDRHARPAVNAVNLRQAPLRSPADPCNTVVSCGSRFQLDFEPTRLARIECLVGLDRILHWLDFGQDLCRIDNIAGNKIEQMRDVFSVVTVPHLDRQVPVHCLAARELPLGRRIDADDRQSAGFGQCPDRPIQYLIGCITRLPLMSLNGLAVAVAL